MNRKKFLKFAGVIAISPLVLSQIGCSETEQPTVASMGTEDEQFNSMIELVDLSQCAAGKTKDGNSGIIVPNSALLRYNVKHRACCVRYLVIDGKIKFDYRTIDYFPINELQSLVSIEYKDWKILDNQRVTIKSLNKINHEKLINMKY